MKQAHNGRYILDGKTPVPCEDLLEWAHWLESADRHVARTTVGEVNVSTVFLGLDHSFTPGATPILFESMVFGGKLDGEQERYQTWDEAERGHQALVVKVRKAEGVTP